MNRKIEKEIGIGSYLTDTPGLGGRLRSMIDDFIVVENFIKPPMDQDGTNTVAVVKVSNWETNRLIRHLSRELGLHPNSIGFAGTKDKRAVTTQLMSFPVPPSRLEKLDIKDIWITDFYRTRKKITLGDLVGNSFEIAIRDFQVDLDEVTEIIQRNIEIIENNGGFPNFFGIQRFGAIRPTTHLMGERIVKKDFEGAVMTYVGNPMEGDEAQSREARILAEETRDWKKLIEVYPASYTFEKSMIGHLIKRPDDYLGALRKLPSNLLLMFIHAYQSHFFNEMVTRRILRKIPLNEAQIGDMVLAADIRGVPDRKRIIPVNGKNIRKIQRRIHEGKAFITAPAIGTEVELAGGVQGEIEREVLAEGRVERKNFNITDISRISSKGIRREIVAPVKNFSWELDEERILLKFDLYKGCYATSLLREFMKSDNVRDY